MAPEQPARQEHPIARFVPVLIPDGQATGAHELVENGVPTIAVTEPE